MKKTLLFFAALCVSALLFGCTTYYKDVAGDYLVNPPNGTVSPYYTEYDISQNAVHGEGEASVLFWIFHFGEGKFCRIGSIPNLTFWDWIGSLISPTQKAVYNAKAASLYNVCEINHADFLVGTSFEYTVSNMFFWISVKCKTSAYPAKVKSIGAAKPIILAQENPFDRKCKSFRMSDDAKFAFGEGGIGYYAETDWSRFKRDQLIKRFEKYLSEK